MDNPCRQIGLLKTLSRDELTEIFALPSVEKRRLITAGYADFTLQQLVLFRGDGTSVVAPFSMFEPTPKTSPDFEELDIIDYGHTVKLGPYEAATSSILYELDPDYKEYYEANRIKDIN